CVHHDPSAIGGLHGDTTDRLAERRGSGLRARSRMRTRTAGTGTHADAGAERAHGDGAARTEPVQAERGQGPVPVPGVAVRALVAGVGADVHAVHELARVSGAVSRPAGVTRS